MSQTEGTITDLTTEYAAKVASDLQLNAGEQERIAAEMTTLEERLQVLQRDQKLLSSVQQALAVQETPGTSTDLPRQARATMKEATKRTSRTQPTLVALIRAHLDDQREPRSATEITAALTQAHPDRGIKTTVVRTTLEGLVARSRARRTKQGSSVFYSSTTASSSAEVGASASDESGQAG